MANTAMMMRSTLKEKIVLIPVAMHRIMEMMPSLSHTPVSPPEHSLRTVRYSAMLHRRGGAGGLRGRLGADVSWFVRREMKLTIVRRYLQGRSEKIRDCTRGQYSTY